MRRPKVTPKRSMSAAQNAVKPKVFISSSKPYASGGPPAINLTYAVSAAAACSSAGSTRVSHHASAVATRGERGQERAAEQRGLGLPPLSLARTVARACSPSARDSGRPAPAPPRARRLATLTPLTFR